jgi:hypothetical protein
VHPCCYMLVPVNGLSRLLSASQARALAALPAEPDVSRWMAGTTALREDNEVLYTLSHQVSRL